MGAVELANRPRALRAGPRAPARHAPTVSEKRLGTARSAITTKQARIAGDDFRAALCPLRHQGAARGVLAARDERSVGRCFGRIALGAAPHMHGATLHTRAPVDVAYARMSVSAWAPTVELQPEPSGLPDRRCDLARSGSVHVDYPMRAALRAASSLPAARARRMAIRPRACITSMPMLPSAAVASGFALTSSSSAAAS